MISALIPSEPRVTRATVIGSAKRRGPALPGFRYPTPSLRVNDALCECPLTTQATPAFAAFISKS